MFIGFASSIIKMLEYGIHLKDDDDDQLFYTNLYLNDKLRVNFNKN